MRHIFKKVLPTIIVAAFLTIIIGCNSQVNSNNETEKLVKNAEKLSTSLKVKLTT